MSSSRSRGRKSRELAAAQRVLRNEELRREVVKEAQVEHAKRDPVSFSLWTEELDKVKRDAVRKKFAQTMREAGKLFCHYPRRERHSPCALQYPLEAIRYWERMGLSADEARQRVREDLVTTHRKTEEYVQWAIGD